MKDEDLIQTLRTASESQNNIPLKMLLTIAAERLEVLASNPVIAYGVSGKGNVLFQINSAKGVVWQEGCTELVRKI